jgi:hypothetical protein
MLAAGLPPRCGRLIGLDADFHRSSACEACEWSDGGLVPGQPRSYRVQIVADVGIDSQRRIQLS